MTVSTETKLALLGRTLAIAIVSLLTVLGLPFVLLLLGTLVIRSQFGILFPDVLATRLLACSAVLLALIAAWRGLHARATFRSFASSAMTIVAALCGLGAYGASYTKPLFPREPVATEEAIRSRLEPLLVERHRSFPSMFELHDLERQISNIRVSGPGSEFDAPTTRYISFTVETDCGRTLEMSARLGPEGGELVGIPEVLCSD